MKNIEIEMLLLHFLVGLKRPANQEDIDNLADILERECPQGLIETTPKEGIDAVNKLLKAYE